MTPSASATLEVDDAERSPTVPAEQSKHRPVHPKYRPDIDGLRAVAVLSVVAFHVAPSFGRGGFIGVDIFFVISGFLISSIILGNLKRDSFSYAQFYSRRIRRIFPSLVVVLAACLIFSWFALLPDELAQLGKHIAGGAGFFPTSSCGLKAATSITPRRPNHFCISGRWESRNSFT